jgi:hypothetical protein
VEPSSVVFFELPSQRFRGYDSTVVPNELVVPLGGEREAGALVVPFPAQATFRTADSSIAEVRPTSDGVRIRGLSDGLTRVEAVAGGTVIGTLFVDVKARRDVTVDFHSASDVDSPPNRSTRPLSDVDRLVATLNEVWGEQANVHFSKRLVDRITVPTALGEEVTDEEIFDFARLRTGAEWNVFFVWEYQPFFLETIPGVFTPQDVEAVTAVNVESGTVTLLEDRECADSLTIAHEAGHFLGMKFGRRGTPPHPPSTIMSICGGLERRRVPSDFADVANP